MYESDVFDLPYEEGELSVTVSVTADGYEPGQTTVTVPTSTSRIFVDVDLLIGDNGVVRVLSPRVREVRQGTAYIYSLNGRLLRRVDAGCLDALLARDVRGSSAFVVVTYEREGRIVAERVMRPLRQQ
jgi:hypothetical protein